MEELKSKIAATVFLPEHLREWQDHSDIKDYAYKLAFDILNYYYKAVDREFLDNTRVRRICRRIDTLNGELIDITPPHINLQNWLWIGQTIELWIEYSLEAEEYEIATNLRKLLNSEYV